MAPAGINGYVTNNTEFNRKVAAYTAAKQNSPNVGLGISAQSTDGFYSSKAKPEEKKGGLLRTAALIGATVAVAAASYLTKGKASEILAKLPKDASKLQKFGAIMKEFGKNLNPKKWTKIWQNKSVVVKQKEAQTFGAVDHGTYTGRSTVEEF